MISLVHTPPSAPPSLSQNNGNEERTFQALTHQGWNEPRLPDTIESANLLSQPPTHYPWLLDDGEVAQLLECPEVVHTAMMIEKVCQQQQGTHTHSRGLTG